MTTIQEALQVRQAQANAASERFDFVREGALATFWRQATPGTTYWRGHLPMQYLPGQVVRLSADSVIFDEDGVSIEMPEQEGVAIWQFLGDDGRARIALQLQRQGQRTLMEIDDNYLRPAPLLNGRATAWTKTHADAMRMGASGYSVEMHRKIVPMMDGLILSTPALADAYDGWNDNIYVCPNSVDPTDWADVKREESDVLRIGYYGSPSHMRDYPLAKKALKWASRQPGVDVVMIGFKPPGWHGTHLDWEDDLFEGRKNLGKIDVGIAPLTVNPWSVGKSDVKALEYAMAGAMPILQDAEPYAPWKAMGWYWLAKTEEDWARLIKEVVSERDYVAQVANSAKEYVLAKRTIQGNIHQWRAAVDAT